MEEYSELFLLAGALLIGISSLIAYFEAIEDPDVDKIEMSFGLHIFRYPKLLILALIGIAIAFAPLISIIPSLFEEKPSTELIINPSEYVDDHY